MESSRRDLLNHMAEPEHVTILENNQNTYHPFFDFTPKTGMAFPKTKVLFFMGKGPYHQVETTFRKSRVLNNKILPVGESSEYTPRHIKVAL